MAESSENPQNSWCFRKSKSVSEDEEIIDDDEKTIREKNNLRAKKWREENMERFMETQKRWKENNKDKIKKIQKKWGDNNTEKVRERNKEWRDKNPEYMKRYKEEINFKKYLKIEHEKIDEKILDLEIKMNEISCEIQKLNERKMHCEKLLED